MKKWQNKVDDFFKWVKGTELVELDDIDVSEDPVRPELTLGFRITNGRKIFGLKYNKEMGYMSQAANQEDQRGEIVVAYTVWSRKRGAGREIITKLREWTIKNNFKRLVTLSPLTPMATHFHIKNGAKQVFINEETQNFEYKL